MPTRRRTLVLLAAACAGPAAWAQGAARESAVKAAFLYKFGAFVEWPAGTFAKPDDPLVIAVLASEAIAADLEQIVASRPAEGRPVAVRRVREGEPLAGAHVLMVGGSREGRLREAAAAAPGPVLVVAERDDALRSGAVLNFVTDGGRVRFTASLPAAEQRNLRLSARLLAVAQTVEGRAR
ncbi:YfiR family protein [Ramlibacter humi]|nr:YfiR family protein [Ramlibacter humi]